MSDSMKSVKTRSLEGVDLDWMVAGCLGHKAYLRHDFMRQRAQHVNHAFPLDWHLSVQTNDPIIGVIETGETQVLPRYGADWLVAGQIIEQNQISLSIKHDGWWVACMYDINDEPKHMHVGSTPLEAAMRCLVDAKVGPVVQVPDGLSQWDAKAKAKKSSSPSL